MARQLRALGEQTRRVQLVGGICFLGGLMLSTLLAQVELIGAEQDRLLSAGSGRPQRVESDHILA